MKETTYFPEVSCAVMDGGILPDGVTACVMDIKQRRQYVQVTRSMINHEGGRDYLPVGIVDIDRRSRKVLIELPTEADSVRTACGSSLTRCARSHLRRRRSLHDPLRPGDRRCAGTRSDPN